MTFTGKRKKAVAVHASLMYHFLLFTLHHEHLTEKSCWFLVNIYVLKTHGQKLLAALTLAG
jgi:hypothetical protein